MLLALTWFYKQKTRHKRQVIVSYKATAGLVNNTSSFFQVKNSESILEYERMAEIGFEKRDFRMVNAHDLICHPLQTCEATQTTSVLWLFLGCVLYGPCLGVCLSLPQVQDIKGRVLSPAGTLPRGSVCCQVGKHN